jgi:hypothetical protein
MQCIIFITIRGFYQNKAKVVSFQSLFGHFWPSNSIYILITLSLVSQITHALKNVISTYSDDGDIKDAFMKSLNGIKRYRDH